LLSDLESNTSQATHDAPSFQRAQVLRTEISALQARYVTLDERTRNLELESKSPGSVHLFSAARVPKGSLPSKAKLIPPLLLPFALLLATGVVVLVDFLDRRIHTETDIEQILGFSPLGTLFHDQDVSMQVFDEGALRLAGGIDQAVRTAGVRTIVLTSVNAGGGTTSIIENLGGALAKLGRKTLTIDSSGFAPPVAYVNDKIDQPVHCAVGGAQLRRQDVDIWSGAAMAQPFSPKLIPPINLLDQAFKDLTTDFDVVLIDCAPILISAETEYLARFADVTLLIAEAEKTTKAQLFRSARLLERLQIPGMGVVINKMCYRWANRATREDLTAFQARLEKGRFSANKGGTPAGFDQQERAERESSTYA
jgi:polysaccharide biosynthesis transport protein